MSKTLGQIAYDAHWSWYDEVSERPKRWDTDADECDMCAWEAAAQAVMRATVASNAFHPITLAKEDVIEAARNMFTQPTEARRRHWREQTRLALEALDKAEVGDG